MKNNYLLWLVALILVNTGWYFVSQQSATQEINRPGADFSESREADLSAIVGDEVDYEIEHCFKSINGRLYNVSIDIKQGSETLYSWEGDTDDGCITYSSSAEEGDITVNTQIEEGVEVTTEITTWPLKDSFFIGLIVFSLGTVAVAFGEKSVRYLIKKKLDEHASSIELTEKHDSATGNDGIWQDPIRPN